MYLNNSKSIWHWISTSLTLTWDVFKFSLDVTGIVTSLCLTLTWDVFKFCYLVNCIKHC